MAISISFLFSRVAQLEARVPALCWVLFSLQHHFSNSSNSQTAQSGAWGLPLLGAGFLYCILSPTGLVSKTLRSLNWSIGDLRAPSAGWCFSLSHLLSKLSDLQTNWLPVFTELYNSSITHSISLHNWPLECVTSAVFGMACLIVIANNCHAVHRSLSSGASVCDCTVGF